MTQAADASSARPVADLEPRPNDVHVWVANLARPDVTGGSRWLSVDEQDRARRYRFERDRCRFVAARAFLRSVLGRYTGSDPAAVRLRTADTGKPTLGPGAGLEFNLSHSGELAICAVATHRVGVDLERVRSVPDMLEISRRFFSAREAAELYGVEECRRLQHFFACWTRKEAYVKATGHGLGASLNAFTVSSHPEHPQLLHVDEDPDARERWTVANLRVPQPYVASLVVEVRDCCIVQRGEA